MIAPGSRVMFTLTALFHLNRFDVAYLRGTVVGLSCSTEGRVSAMVKWDGDFLKTRVGVKDLVKL